MPTDAQPYLEIDLGQDLELTAVEAVGSPFTLETRLGLLPAFESYTDPADRSAPKQVLKDFMRCLVCVLSVRCYRIYVPTQNCPKMTCLFS